MNFLFLLLACGEKGTDSGEPSSEPNAQPSSEPSGEPSEEPTTYEFTDDNGESTVSYSGQIARHALISSLKSYIGGMSGKIADGSYFPTSQEQIVSDMLFYYDCPDDLCGDISVGDSGTVQQILSDISTGKNLVGKTAGNDSVTDHKDWLGGDFSGWANAESPEALVRSWIETIATQAFAQVNGTFAFDPDGNVIESVYLTPEGHDLNQLVQKFLLGAIPFSQGADDYLDDDTEGKGLLASHEIGDEKYTSLEHAWDEGFGYFGAAINYDVYTDEQIADGESIDTNGDALIDLKTEKNWGNSVNAGKGDKGAIIATDFTQEAWDGFLQGRYLLHQTRGAALSSEDFSTLTDHRDQALMAWEKAISATVIHYINDTLQDMNTFGTSDYSFPTHAKHWGEMKGFALGLQFNPHSPVSDSDFDTIHDLFGDAPVLSNATAEEIEAYKADLVTARSLMGTAYGFATENLGDDAGENGW